MAARGTVRGPDPGTAHPLPGHPRVCFLRNMVDRPNIEIGDYTYYDDPVEPERFAEKCVLHHYEFMGDRLVIGRFCAIASGVRSIMNGANHAMTGFSTYPFQIFGHGWEDGFQVSDYSAGSRGDTVVGNDVWIGMDATVMPGVSIGDGAIIGAAALVARDVPPYGVASGNPARLVRKRFDDAVISELLDIAWWDWDAGKITRNVAAIVGNDLAALRAARRGRNDR